MHTLYNLGIRAYGVLVWLAQPFTPKAKKWISGRKNWRKQLYNQPSLKGCYWFHCASLGEFEQGRPLLERIKQEKPDRKIIITFFSPSGYEIRKNYEGADCILYLPLDTPRNAQNFIDLLQPDKAFFIKYEFWANYLFELKRQKIPVYNVSGLFRKEQRFFKKNNQFFRKVLGCFTHFFVQDDNSKQLLNSIGISNVTISGDTRYDRVSENAKQIVPHPVLSKFSSNHTVMVAGSSWPVDEDLLLPLINSGAIPERIIIAPHEVHESHLTAIEKKLSVPFLRLSSCDSSTDFGQTHVLIIDCIGLLANAYYYGNYAYVGGAFGNGLHNILEPAAFGLPVIFGPNHTKFPEAQAFIQAGIGFSISDETTYLNACSSIRSGGDTLQNQVKEFISQQTGATQIICSTV